MKTFLLLIVVAVAAFGQTGSIVCDSTSACVVTAENRPKFSGMVSDRPLTTPTIQSAADLVPKFMVHWQTEEPDYESNTRYAMVCGGSNPDCNTPRKTVDRYTTFDSEVEAFKFIKADFKYISNGTTVQSAVGGLAGPYFGKTYLLYGSKFVAIYSVKPIPVKVTEYTVEIPQPAKTEWRTKVEKQ